MAVHKKTELLYLVDLDQELPGFRKFISCWIYKKSEYTLIIDPGPTSTIPVLEKALKELEIKKIDYILLTHIHIDHAGGTGLLLSKYPEAKVLCHTKGIAHMINPEKLWLGSLKVLGKIAESYKPVVAIPQDRIFFKNIVPDPIKIEVIETPGHALHHLNFLIDGYLFAGEVAGVNYPFRDQFYLRIATPPRFIYEVYKESLLKAAMLDSQAICFGHYDLSNNVKEVFNAAKDQLELWMETTRQSLQKNNSVIAEDIFEKIIESDPSTRAYKNLENDIQIREKYFALNSIKGMLEYIRHSKNTNHNQ
jgi:glyoxylase-like metal-dependent hydrolase (beta-lactamase superfamily II)